MKVGSLFTGVGGFDLGLERAGHEVLWQVENHKHAMSLHYMYYNFVRKHQTLTKQAGGIHKTPAMAAGIAGHVWTMEEVVGLLEATER